MAVSISLGSLDTYLQDRLVNTIGSPVSQTERVRAINQVIQMMQATNNWDTTKRVKTISYLNEETDYSIVNDFGVSDFKDVYDVRDPDELYERFESIDERLFAEYARENRVVNVYSVEERDNAHIMRMIYRDGNTRFIVHEMDSLTTNGTWASDTTDSDATTLAVDTNRKKDGSGSFKFNIDVSQSSNNYAGINTTDLTAIDLTDYENIATWRAWVDLSQMTAAQLALISSMEIRFGDDASNYWAITVDSSATGGTFTAGWNRVSWDWLNATTTGSPTVTSVNYIDLRINYGATMTDVNNIRWDQLVVIQPRDLEMVYFSEHMVNNSGTLQNEFSTGTIDTAETLLLPTRHRDGFLHLVAEYLYRQMKDEDSQEWLYHQAKGTVAFKQMQDDIGSQIVREIPAVKIRDHHRVESYNQWG